MEADTRRRDELLAIFGSFTTEDIGAALAALSYDRQREIWKQIDLNLRSRLDSLRNQGKWGSKEALLIEGVSFLWARLVDETDALFRAAHNGN